MINSESSSSEAEKTKNLSKRSKNLSQHISSDSDSDCEESKLYNYETL